MTGTSLLFAPLLPWWLLAAAGVLATLLLAYGGWRRARGTLWRLVAVAALVLALARPTLVEEKRAPEGDVALVVEDVSPSQRIGDRTERERLIATTVTERLQHLPGLEVRRITVGGDGAPHGTEIMGEIASALKDVPARRVAGIAVVTDGQIHDIPASGKPPLAAPFHVLLDGSQGEIDRRIVLKEAPTFGLVGKDVALKLRVEDLGAPAPAGQTARVTIRRDGGAAQTEFLPVGLDQTVHVPVEHGGANVIEIEVEAGPHELTLDNNRAALVVNGIRDRLKVLLVSGEPHTGERTWRNLLKADPSVDLVHFTILRPPDKQDRTPVKELSLIAFPIRELFDLKLAEFDLIIFDRYQRRGILPQNYLENIARYVRHGGALLEAGGTSEQTVGSLADTPLGAVLPARASGDILTGGFKASISETGARHPVTEALPGAPATPGGVPAWGRWFRQADAEAARGWVVMTGLQGKPLLVLDRVGEGRVAQLLSDQAWLWTRGFEGGGPQAELLRRLAYWLMKEPDLEEEALKARIEGTQLVITRRALQAGPATVQLTRPNGKTETVTLSPGIGGASTATLTVDEPGLYRVTDGTRMAVAAAGALNPIELADVRTTDRILRPLAAATGGGVVWAGTGAPIPEVRQVGATGSASGSGWIGFRANGDYVVTGFSQIDLMPPYLALALGLGALLLAWRREGG